MNLAIIACKALTRDLSYALALSPHICEIFWMEQGLHNTPELLREQLQEQLRQVEERHCALPEHKRYDAILLGYGLCSNGIVGVGSAVLPVVAPRCDDCIALFLGSQERYLTLFKSHSGIYWYNPGWIEQGELPSEETTRRKYDEFVELYGEDNADFLMENEIAWVKNYSVCGYIRSPFYHSDALTDRVREAAAFFDWQYMEFDGKMDFFTKLTGGDWNDTDFLVCQSGQRIAESYDERKIIAVEI